MTHPLTPREKVIEQLSHMARGKNTLYGSRVVAQMAIDHLTALASGSGDHAELALNAKAAQTWALGIYENREQAARRSTFIDSDLPATVLALLAENAALRGVVTDQAALHLNMMRGGVPKLAPANIGHLYHGEEAKEVIAEVDRQNPGSNTRATEAEAELREYRITADLLVSTLKADKAEAERKLAEAEETNTRWAIRFAELRRAAGIGVKPMLSEVPGELRKMRSLIDRAADLMRQCTDPERFEASTLNVYANMRAWLSDLSKESERG